MEQTPESWQPVSRQTLTAQVKERILEKLKSGELKPSDKLPAGAQFAQSLGVSAGTMRKALEELVAEGILVRRQGSGTYVRSYRDGGYWNRFQNFQKPDGRLIVYESRTVCSERIGASGRVAHCLGIEPGEPVIRTIRHMFDAQTHVLIGADRLFMHPKHFPADAEARMLHPLLPGESLYGFYEREMGVVITDASNVLTAFQACPQLAEEIRCPGFLGQVVLQIERVGRTYGRVPVEYRIETTLAELTRIQFD